MGAERTQALMHILEEHEHSVQKVYPPGADAITLTGAAGAWAEGAKTEIVPANGITSNFDIHWATIVGGANDQYEIYLYAGGVGAEVLIATIPFQRVGVQTAAFQAAVMTPIIAANQRISASCASSGGGAATCTLKLSYHTY